MTSPTEHSAVYLRIHLTFHMTDNCVQHNHTSVINPSHYDNNVAQFLGRRAGTKASQDTRAVQNECMPLLYDLSADMQFVIWIYGMCFTKEADWDGVSDLYVSVQTAGLIKTRLHSPYSQNIDQTPNSG